MLAIQYYWKLKDLYRKLVSKAEFIYIYTIDDYAGCEHPGASYRVDKVMVKTRKNKYQEIEDAPHETLLLSRDKRLPSNVMVQVKFNPLEFKLYDY